MKKSERLDCQGNEFFPKQKGTPSLVKIEHKNTATLDSVRSKKKSKVAVLQLCNSVTHGEQEERNKQNMSTVGDDHASNNLDCSHSWLLVFLVSSRCVFKGVVC